MSRLAHLHILVLTIALYFGESHHLSAQLDPDHPNILLIIADDLGSDYLAGFSDSGPLPQTPHLDSLQAAGLGFQNAWAAPMCTPTRAAILSGKYGVKTGIVGVPGELDSNDVSLFDRVKESDGNYATALIGKWHLDTDDPSYEQTANVGIDHYEGIWSGFVQDYFAWTKVSDEMESPETEYVTQNFTHAAIDWIGDQSSAWFLVLSHAAPHDPFHVPPAGTFSQAPTNSNKQKFRAAIESLDHYTGMLLDSVDQAVLDNTVIIFVGDNGTPPGVTYFPMNRGKGTLYQGGLSVPLFITGPGVSRIGEDEDHMVHVADIHATITDIAKDTLNGGYGNSLSVRHMLDGSAGAVRAYNYSEFEDGWTIRNERYKYIFYYDCEEEFFDLQMDSIELNNLIGSLNMDLQRLKQDFLAEAAAIRAGWSCQDGIQNGSEQGIDCGGPCYPCTDQVLFYCNEDSIVICQDILVDRVVKAERSIESAYLADADSIYFRAEDYINLLAGFEVTSGTEFTVEMDTCTMRGIGDDDCSNSNSTNTSNIDCCEVPQFANEYTETIIGDVRQIESNSYPDHEFCFANMNNIPSPKD